MADTFVGAIGRRKESVARVRISDGNGLIIVNGKPINEYFMGEVNRKTYMKPFEVSGSVGKSNVSIKVMGGGAVSQLGATVHGIARAIALADGEKRTPLKKEGLLTRDPRAKERRKYGLAQKARAKKQSPKR